MLEIVKTDLEASLPADLVNALLTSYVEMKHNFLFGRYEPSELNGGKFVEACIRILQFETSGTYTVIGVQIKDMIGSLRAFENLPSTSANDSFRIHIPRTLIVIYNIRNKRGVGHLGGDINPNFTDSSLLISCSDWVLAELLRIYYKSSLQESQRIVDSLIRRNYSLVHEFESVVRVMLPSLSQKDQTLLLLAHHFPEWTSRESLEESIEPSRVSDYRRTVLKNLHKKRFIEYSLGGQCQISTMGISYVEQNYSRWLSKLA
jgi:hypothetical protein